MDEDQELVTIEVPEDDPAPVVVTEPDDDDELAGFSSKVRKRIDKLTQKYREADRQREAALRYAESVRRENEELARRTQESQVGMLSQAEARVGSELERAKRDLKTAIDAGDPDAQVEAQAKLTKLLGESTEIERLKRQPAPRPQPQQQQPQGDPKAEKWAAKHANWFGKDAAMTGAAYAIDAQLKSEGVDPSSDQYYQELDSRLRDSFPHKFREAPSRERVVQTVAGASRSSGAARRVQLTPSEVAVAKRLGVPLEDYYKSKMALGEQ